jgi:hypothetical protein
MTETQQLEAVRSLAAELIRVAHSIDMPDDDVIDQALDLAVIVQTLGGGKLCACNLRGLAMLVHHLQHCHDAEKLETH